MPVSQADVERWKAFGGSMKDTNGRKSFTDPSGKRLKTWKEAERLMDGDAKMVDVAQKAVAAPAKKRSRPAPASDAEDKHDDSSAEAEKAVADEETENIDGSNRSRKRAATAGKNYNESNVKARLPTAGSKVQTTEDIFCKTETEALEGTAGSDAKEPRRQRRLKLFAVVNSEDDMMQLQRLGQQNSEELFLQGAVYPSTGKAAKAEGRRMAQRFGPIKSWKASYGGSEPELVVSTALADYTIMTCVQEYRELYNDVREQITVCHSIVLSLKGKKGKKEPKNVEEQLTFDNVLAAVSRAKSVKGYMSVRDAVLLNGSFILSQVPAMQSVLHKDVKLESSKFIAELKAELKNGPPKTLLQQQSIGIQFNDKPKDGAGASKDEQMTEEAPEDDCDAQYARRVQAKLDAAKYHHSQRGGVKQAKGQVYIKISEEEIADDYPAPKEYDLLEHELDEVLVNGDDDLMMDVDPECLPTMIIDKFAVYNSDGFMSTLELLPMWQNVDPDVELFGSGIISQLDDEDSVWGTGHALNNLTARDLDMESRAQCAGGSGAGTSAGAGCSGTTEAQQQPAGMPVFLSQIIEWHVEIAESMVFIVVRTDFAWYKVRTVLDEYKPWFNPILKVSSLTAYLMKGFITLRDDGSRSSKLSFQDIVNDLSSIKVEDNPSVFVSSKKDKVERYLVVHGQIILNQFKNFPIKEVQQCSFVSNLQDRMRQRRHSKLFMSKRKITGAMRIGRKANPMRNREPKSKPKPMTATATTFVKAIWADYFNAGAAEKENAGEQAKPVEDDENAEEDVEADVAVELEDGLAQDSAKNATRAKDSKAKAKAKTSGKKKPKCKLEGPIDDPETRLSSDEHTSYKQIYINDVLYSLGDVVILEGDDLDDAMLESEEEEVVPEFGLLQYIGAADKDGKDVELQMRMMQHGKATVLGDTASDHEIFMAQAEPISFLPKEIRSKCNAERLEVPHGPLKQRDEANKKVEDLLKDNAGKGFAERKLLYRMQYRPKDGMFCKMPADLMLGNFIPEEQSTDGQVDDSQRFSYMGTDYGAGCFVYMMPEQFKAAPKRKATVKDEDAEEGEEDEDDDDQEDKPFQPKNTAAKPTKKKAATKASKEGPENSSMTANKNPSGEVDDVHQNIQDKYYMHKYKERDLNKGKGDLDGLVPYTVAQILKVETKKGKNASGEAIKHVAGVTVRLFSRPEDHSAKTAYESHPWTLYATSTETTVTMDKLKGRCHVALNNDIKTGPQEMTGQPLDVFVCEYTLVKGNLKPKPKSFDVSCQVTDDIKPDASSEDKEASDLSMATLDIFAGCGGLSEGMHQAGAAKTKWAIEYWKPAADAFKLNNPDAFMYNGNCNVMLHRAMVKSDLEDQCDACDECREESAQFPEDQVARLPLPGEVEFICGGPPCQGYSGMNRFNKGNWSMVQNSMVMSYLSYADFYRPRYWLLENVRNFVSHNKSHTFRLTLRTLLDMGYQVRFGVLNAGNFGVSQSRKRTFIWAAAPDEELPDWPRALTVFKSPQLCIKLPCGESYTAISDGKHARLRAVTVRDTIGDLPEVKNGESDDKRAYSNEPVSEFQRQIRGEEMELKDHICKTMNDLNMRRCELVPRETPGADWRSLVLHVNKNPEDAVFNDQKIVPWCLPNTADRHNGWRGLFGRLNWEGHFPTSVTDPNPMGKVGQVFHPKQDRIVSVRECARAQGFPDKFLFSGSVHDRHKEVGNAVPPPLAAALGRQLRKKLVKTAEVRRG